MKDNMRQYLDRPYHIEAVRCVEGGWFAKVIELPGCMTQADTWDGVFLMIMDAMEAWIGTALEDGCEIPEPKGDNDD